ncbi:hypothetical protein ACLESO_47520 [Pyxidicoccus sp. 3LG]
MGLGVGILAGAGAGVLLGYLIGNASDSGCGGNPCGSESVYVAAAMGLVGALVGGLVGTSVGASVGASEWDAASRRSGATPRDSQPKASSRLQLMPAIGVGAGGAMGGVLGRF